LEVPYAKENIDIMFTTNTAVSQIPLFGDVDVSERDAHLPIQLKTFSTSLIDLAFRLIL
jgi:hypothetical protein